MNELMIEILSGLGVLASGFFYTKFQTTQNHKEIDQLKRQMQDNEKTDAARDTEIAVLKSTNGDLIIGCLSFTPLCIIYLVSDGCLTI